MGEATALPESVRYVLDAIVPPAGEEWQRQYLTIQGHLISAASGLIESRNFMLRTPFRRSSWGPHIYEDFLIAVRQGGIRWRGRENTQLFALDFYLNKAQSDIAAAADGVVNGWILESLEDIEEKPIIDVTLLPLFPGTRLRILSALLEKEELLRAARQRIAWLEARLRGGPEPQASEDVGVPTTTLALKILWQNLEKYYDTELAQQTIHAIAGMYIKDISGPLRDPREIDREAILQLLLNNITQDMSLPDDACAGITLSRVNAFKHLTYGVRDRYDFVYPVEWVVTAKGLTWLGSFFRSMIPSIMEMRERRRS